MIYQLLTGDLSAEGRSICWGAIYLLRNDLSAADGWSICWGAIYQLLRGNLSAAEGRSISCWGAIYLLRGDLSAAEGRSICWGLSFSCWGRSICWGTIYQLLRGYLSAAEGRSICWGAIYVLLKGDLPDAEGRLSWSGVARQALLPQRRASRPRGTPAHAIIIAQNSVNCSEELIAIMICSIDLYWYMSHYKMNSFSMKQKR